jgi:hypothetical protein
MQKVILVLSTLSFLVSANSLLAQSTQVSGEAFSWYGELVALDENARIITVKSRVVGEQALAEFGRLKSGEQVMLTWSGLDGSSDAIYRAVRSADVSRSDERFTFPVDFVAFDAARQYVTFKVQIPENSTANLKSLKPGEWVTATSPHGPSSKTTPVLMIRPYVVSASQLKQRGSLS